MFYVGLLREHPDLENPTIVVVTDRKDLDGQLYETFASCCIPLRTNPVQATDREDLKAIGRTSGPAASSSTTIQKFAPVKGQETGRRNQPAFQHNRYLRRAHRTGTASRASWTKKGESTAMACQGTCTMRCLMPCISA